MNTPQLTFSHRTADTNPYINSVTRQSRDRSLPGMLFAFAGCIILSIAGPGVLCGAEHASEHAATISNPDSLRAVIKQLRNNASALRKKATELRSSATDTTPPATESLHVPDTPSLAPVVTKDTVEILSLESTETFLKSLVKGHRRGTRERGFGGGIGAAMGIYAINMRPVDELLDVMNSDAAFSNARLAIDKRYAFFQFSGFCGYGAVGNGLRIGGLYNSGAKSYTTHFNDTTYTIEIKPSFGGLLLEKAVVHDNTNLFFGGIIGGGNIRVRPSKATNAITSISLDSDDNRINFNELNASSLLLEVHGGVTYTMTKWFHIGGDFSAPLFFSQSGFVTPGDYSITNGFVSLNPGIRIRIIIGNIG